jgi:hypothetical protein|tara:strand:+ start:717 stop:956 length:240 start_codon:yes stop_codon:yes gene_type:complete
MVVPPDSVSAEPGISIAEPTAEVVLRTMLISGVSASEIHVHEQLVESRHGTLPLCALSTIHPGEDAAISISEFLKFDAL